MNTYPGQTKGKVLVTGGNVPRRYLAIEDSEEATVGALKLNDEGLNKLVVFKPHATTVKEIRDATEEEAALIGDYFAEPEDEPNESDVGAMFDPNAEETPETE